VAGPDPVRAGADQDGTGDRTGDAPARVAGDPEDIAGDPGDGEGDPGDGEGDAGDVEGDPLRFRRWMYSSAVGAAALGAARGLHQALSVEQRRPAFVIEVDGGDDEGPIHLELDPDDPTRSVAVIRRPVDPPTPPGPSGG
jgi:hypothetical protein